MNNKDDKQLMISLVEEGNLNAFEELLTRYENSLFNYINRHISDFHTAQDIFQETFYRIFKDRKSFNSDLRFSTWAFRIASNLCIDELKKKTRELEVSLEDIKLKRDGIRGNHFVSITPRFEEECFENKFFKKDLEEKIKNLVTSLPEKLKSVFILSEYQQLPCKEISRILEIPLGTVKSRLHNGFKQLVITIKKSGLVNELQ